MKIQSKDLTDSTYDQLLKARGLDKKPKRSLHFQYKRDVILPDKYKTKFNVEFKKGGN